MKKIIITFLISIIFISTFSYSLASETAGTLNFDVTSTADIKNPVGKNEDEVMLINEELEETEKGYTKDIYTIDEDVKLTENVSGNVYIIADKINIENIEIDGNAFLIGKEINIKNTYISGSSYIIGENVTLNSLMKDLYLIGEVVELGNSSYITRNAKIIGETINLSGIVEKECLIDSSSLNVDDETMINGDLKCTTDSEAVIGKNAKILNLETKIREKKEISEDTISNILSTFKYSKIIVSVLKALVIIGILLVFSKNIDNKNEKVKISEMLIAIVKGTVFLIIVPIISLLLIISILGAGIGLILLLMYIVILYVSTSVVAFVFAKNIINDGSKIKILFLGVMIFLTYCLISMVPVLGTIVTFIIGILGIGLTLDLFKTKENKEKVIIEN